MSQIYMLMTIMIKDASYGRKGGCYTSYTTDLSHIVHLNHAQGEIYEYRLFEFPSLREVEMPTVSVKPKE